METICQPFRAHACSRSFYKQQETSLGDTRKSFYITSKEYDLTAKKGEWVWFELNIVLKYTACSEMFCLTPEKAGEHFL